MAENNERKPLKLKLPEPDTPTDTSYLLGSCFFGLGRKISLEDFNMWAKNEHQHETKSCVCKHCGETYLVHVQNVSQECCVKCKEKPEEVKKPT